MHGMPQQLSLDFGPHWRWILLQEINPNNLYFIVIVIVIVFLSFKRSEVKFICTHEPTNSFSTIWFKTTNAATHANPIKNCCKNLLHVLTSQ